MDLLSDAINFVTEAFEGKKRKCTELPAVLHSLEAAVIVSSMTCETDVIAAALLHDVVEDAGVTPETLRARFGERVTELVLAESEDKRIGVSADKTWKLRKEETISLLESTNDIGVKMICLGDKLSNMRSLYSCIQSYGDSTWESFNQKDPEQHRWYYGTIAQALSELKKYPAWQEYNSLIDRTFVKNEG